MISFSDKKDTTVIVRGPTVVRVEGRATVFGCDIRQLKVAEGKAIPIYLEEDSTLFFDDGTFFIPINGSTIPNSWKKAAARSENSFFIYGSSDSGKSSLATYLNNTIPGRKVIVDLDIGQSSVAHPGAMGIGISNRKVTSISEVEMVDGEFVGTISPGGMETRCLNAVFDVKRKVEGMEGVKIIDSTGWVRGRKAKEYKLAKLNILKPELVLAFEKPPFADFVEFEIFEVEPFAAAKRSRSARINFRSRRYAELLAEAREMDLDVKKLHSRSWKLFKGERLDGEELGVLRDILGGVVYAERGDDFLNVFVEEKPDVGKGILRTLKEIYSVEDLYIVAEEELKGLIVGLYSSRYLGFGIVTGIDYSGRLRVLTAIKDGVSRIEFGNFRLDEEFRECYIKFI
jgi:polynucleotide 5'-hydroxyl-kinase GRC3/NOL9